MNSYPQKEIVFDPSKDNKEEVGFISIETEMELLRCESEGFEKIWVRGDLCEYVRTLYRVRKWAGINLRELQSPYVRLQQAYGIDVNNISPELLNELVEIYNRENIEDLGEVLTYITGNNFWTLRPTNEHAAQWLTLSVDERLIGLIQPQLNVWRDAVPTPILKEIYSSPIDQKNGFIEKWLFDKDWVKILGVFPLKLEEQYFKLIRDKIGRALRATDGAAVLELPRRTPNKEAYAAAITEYFACNPNKLNANYLAFASPLLGAEHRSELQQLLTLSSIEPLAAEADCQTALEWAKQYYLPFRQMGLTNPAVDQDKADTLAASFVNWLLNNYPSLTTCDSEKSPINIRTHHTVKNLAEKHWVLWVVADGLNYTYHQKLLKFLGRYSNLRLIQDDTVLAVLPTITKRAKYGLTVGKFPSQTEKVEEDPHKYFIDAFPTGVYAGDTGLNKLEEGLKSPTPTVCYWNFMQVDTQFHKQTNLDAADIDVLAALESLAKKINGLVNKAHDPNRVAVVVCSDHGQVLRSCSKLNVELNGAFAHGRTILGFLDEAHENTTNEYAVSSDGETVYLNPKGFRLHEPTTVTLKTGYFKGWGNNTGDEIGTHGGLFPEETVLGLSVLVRQPNRKDLIVTMAGTGESGKPGTVKVVIDNPNSVPVNQLSLTVEDLSIADQSELFNGSVPAQQQKSFEIPVDVFPNQQINNEFIVKGSLHYQFEDGVPEECPVSGKLICKTMYSAKNPSLRDRFKK